VSYPRQSRRGNFHNDRAGRRARKDVPPAGGLTGPAGHYEERIERRRNDLCEFQSPDR